LHCDHNPGLETCQCISIRHYSPPFQGGECVRTETVCQFIHTFSALGSKSRLNQPRSGDGIDLLLPAAAECPIKLNECQKFVAPGLSKPELRIEQIAICIERAQQCLD